MSQDLRMYLVAILKFVQSAEDNELGVTAKATILCSLVGLGFGPAWQRLFILALLLNPRSSLS